MAEAIRENDFSVGLKSLKYILSVLVVGVLVGMTAMAERVHAQGLEYHPRFGAIRLDDEVRAAIEKFPDLASCLLPNAVSGDETDLNAIDWDKISNDGDAKVCLFMIFEQLAGPEEVKAWLANQGFRTWGPIEQGYSRSVLRRFGYDVSSKVFNTYKNPGVGGGWSLEGQYPKFPTGGFTPYWRRVLSRAQNLGVHWFPDGKLMNVRVTYQSIFN